MSPEPSPWRILSIAANLLPPEIVDARRLRRIRRSVLAGLMAVSLCVASWYGVATYHTERARSALNAVNDEVQRQLVQQRTFAEVINIQSESTAIRSQLGVLLGSDLRWSVLLVALRGAATDGVALLSVFGVTASQATGGGPVAQLPSVAKGKVIGTLTITASAPSQSVAAGYVDALGRIEGLAGPLLGDATVLDGVLQFTVRVDITDASLGGRYATTPASTGTGGG